MGRNTALDTSRTRTWATRSTIRFWTHARPHSWDRRRQDIFWSASWEWDFCSRRENATKCKASWS
eukprot:8624273-Heterocapsa_arctica.AAC.1